ncbi:hypothetical protein HPT27_18980 [Permianibacter sp. IMCC34836]|uniref:DUF6776 family protein n=1 Tax=Permianibacter fluminis TaxID=2738515 RepID=UPI0015575D6D|nr:DUF6776 family protein [Permianibacter fluminis]NQD39107.1 hypothetical protein [Permianibacter fluminis]
MNKNTTSQYVVVERKPRSWHLRRWLLILLVLAAVFVAGRVEDYYVRRQLADARTELSEQVSQLQRELAMEKQTRTALSQSRQVDQMASSELQTTLKTLQDTVKELEKENAFYRSIMNPSGEKSGLQIESFTVLPLGADRVRYRLVLAQLRSHEKNLRGRLQVQLVGTDNKALDLFVLAGVKAESQKFDFRYFQNVEGEVALPAGFVPREVRVSASQDGLPAVERLFAWPQPEQQNVQ